MSYSKSLIEAVARDILKKPKGPFNSFLKTANIQNERNEFLAQYGFEPDAFSNDPVASAPVLAQKKALEQQIKNYYQQHNQNNVMTKEMVHSRNDMIRNLNRESSQAIQNESINRTMQAAKVNPEAFESHLKRSNESDAALKSLHHREIGGALGGLAGAAAGFVGGNRLPKNTHGILQKSLGSAAGAVGGGLLGGTIGNKLEENKSGYLRKDILAPYQIADRIHANS